VNNDGRAPVNGRVGTLSCQVQICSVISEVKRRRVSALKILSIAKDSEGFNEGESYLTGSRVAIKDSFLLVLYLSAVYHIIQ
jgi:hypothetical protein